MTSEVIHTATNRRPRLQNFRMAKAADNSTADMRQVTGGVRVDEVVLMTVALVIWLVSIVLFVRRWTRLRVLEPLQAQHRYSPKNMDRVRIVHNPRHSIIYHTCSRRMSETLQARQSQSLRRTLDSLGTPQLSPQLSPSTELPPNVKDTAMTSPCHNGALLLPPVTNSCAPPPEGVGAAGQSPGSKRRTSAKCRGSISASVFRRKLTTESPLATPTHSPGPSRPQSPVTLQPHSGSDIYLYMLPAYDKPSHDDVTTSSSNFDLSNSATLTLTCSPSVSCLNGNSQKNGSAITSQPVTSRTSPDFRSIMTSPSSRRKPLPLRKMAALGKGGRHQPPPSPAADSLLKATVIKAAISLATDKRMLS